MSRARPNNMETQPADFALEHEPAPASGTDKGVGSGELVLLDDDRTPTRAGDTVCFDYGIPPIGVRAEIIQRGRSLIALTPGHTPPECKLRTLRRHVGGWVKQNTQGQPRPSEHQ